MSRPKLPQPARRALRRQQSNAGFLLAIGISLTGLSLTPVTLAAGLLPRGGTYVTGTGTIASQGNGLVITQPGATRGVIEWNSFSIGKTNSVTFDNGSGATLNRVTGGSPSAILGRLGATGSVYVVNPQGIVVGPSGVITTGGRFVASTLDICNDAFIQGSGSLTLSGNSNAAVINLGKISSGGGDVFLIARHDVINAGTVAAPNGTAELAAGEQVLLQDSAGSRQVFVQTGSQGTVVNKGRITAAQVSLQAADGNVYALAGSGTRIRATGTASRDGHVWLVADGGRVEQFGKITANNADGSGGTVDTQAAQLTFGRHASVHAGQWNLSTPDFTIDDSAAHTLQRSLNAGTSIDVTTTGANGATGDLGVASSLRWSGPASLTLAAYRNVSVTTGTTIANNGAGNLTLRADASGIDNGGSVINGGTVDWSKSTGIVTVLYDMGAYGGSFTPGTLLSNAAWSVPPNSGLVTQITAYRLVNSLTDLQSVSADLAGNYAIGKDIDASASTNSGFVPLGNYSTPFSGQFDGRGHQIQSLRLAQSVDGGVSQPPVTLQAEGLFGLIGSAGVVRNIAVNGSINSYGTYGGFGILAGVNEGTIVRGASSGSIRLVGNADDASSGGLVGMNLGTVARSSSSVGVYTEGLPGGLVGDNELGGVIEQSYASGAVTAVAHTVGGGGLAGRNEGTITQSYATGAVAFEPNYCGGTSYACDSGAAGLVASNSGKITQSFATGQVTQAGLPGQVPPSVGIAFSNTGTIGNDVYWNKDTTGTNIGVYSGTAMPAANGLTSAQMSMPSSFVGYGFEPNGVWSMPAGATHPVLSWQLAP
ncbi:filamentous hemagglutinin N-terminal domain-containing protein [Paraburkholderia sp. WSM4179]|uniref:two-partner secretion domain-containing protein n=1 Tax=unclassified Paraburkholderia TaxID=2615204 RepID=UPI0024770911|nr:filamentous hemagglutinin N-terminal domain-containing protein [Paraburkholderia sp. WSM4179]